MTRAYASVVLALLLSPVVAGAQIFRVGQRSQDPQFAVSAGVGLFQSQSVIDGTTRSEWSIGDGTQYRASLEYLLRSGSAIGVVATHARVPFRYESRSDCPPPGTGIPCTNVDGDVTVRSLWGGFHSGARGQGFHGVFDAGLGYTWYRDFAADDGPELDAMEADRDFSFYLGAGFGFGITRRLAVSVVQDVMFVRHQGEGLSGDDRTTTQQRATRLTVRYGFGQRRAGL